MAEIKFISWSESLKKIDLPYFLNYRDLTLLNTLAPTYHSGFGYDLDDISPESDANLSYQLNLIPKLVVACDDDHVLINTGIAKDFSSNHMLRHKTIIVRLNPEGHLGWKHKPNKTNETCFHNQIATPAYWYEFPAEIYKSYSKTCNLIGPLSDRHYIHVIDLFDEIELRSEEKGQPLTIDDVLFACRGLCLDDTRCVEHFNILSDDGSKLVLMANIDNWSS